MSKYSTFNDIYTLIGWQVLHEYISMRVGNIYKSVLKMFLRYKSINRFSMKYRIHLVLIIHSFDIKF